MNGLASSAGAGGWRREISSAGSGWNLERVHLECRDDEPGSRYEHECVGQHGAVLAFGAVGLGGNVPVGIVDRQQVRFRRLVERVNEELDGEEQEEHRRDAE